MSWLKTLDMQVLMMSPIMAVLALVGWVTLGLGIIRVGLPFGTLLPLLVVMTALNLAYLGMLVTAVVSQARTSLWSYLALTLATYPYAVLISLANLTAVILLLKRGGRLWLKTEKTGFVDQPLMVTA